MALVVVVAVAGADAVRAALVVGGAGIPGRIAFKTANAVDSRGVLDETGAEDLIGQFDVPISPSGTFVISEDWRFITEKGSSVFLMPDKADGCVNLIPASEMEKMLASVRERAQTDPECYQALQVIGEHSSQVEVDASGTVALPDFIRNEAGLKDRAILKGTLRQIKIWNPERLEEAGR